MVRVSPLAAPTFDGRGRFVVFGVFVFNNDAESRDVQLQPSPLRRLLEVSRYHRLHPGLVLVGVVRMDPGVVLDLRWPMVHLDQGWIETQANSVLLPDPVAGLLAWHAARQRLDRRRAVCWSGTDRVFQDECGHQFDVSSADVAVQFFCMQAGLPALSFAGLRHPCLR